MMICDVCNCAPCDACVWGRFEEVGECGGVARGRITVYGDGNVLESLVWKGTVEPV